MFFFFVKQKTAYEMRISDWSSDVCSSDLLWKIGNHKSLRYRCHTGHAYTAPVLLAEQTAKIQETLWVALRMFEERRNLLVTMVTSHNGKSNHPAAERAKRSEVHKIGRASCRERVCQYVWISLVAV